MLKVSKNSWLIMACSLIATGIFFSQSVYAESGNPAVSKAGIRFVDRRESKETNDNSKKKETAPTQKELNLPLANEKVTPFLLVIGLIISIAASLLLRLRKWLC